MATAVPLVTQPELPDPRPAFSTLQAKIVALKTNGQVLQDSYGLSSPALLQSVNRDTRYPVSARSVVEVLPRGD
ncbi:hypothetical protein PM082_017560 [Marasmius tenuissimus]|nr:hypothetical protein PM082_017560 [Marasmius tenuissimus]